MNCDFSGGNYDANGTYYSNMQILSNNYSVTNSARNIGFSNCIFDLCGIQLNHPYFSVDVLLSTFNNISIPAVSLVGEPPASVNYPNNSTPNTNHININNNTLSITSNNGQPLTNGIYVQDASTPRTASPLFDMININNNNILYYQWNLNYGIAYTPSDQLAAIHLVNSSVIATGNTINGASAITGIMNTGSDAVGGNLSNSFFCSNTIIYCFGSGMQTQLWNGFAKSNDISLSDIGHLVGQKDKGVLLYNNYHNNTGPGIRLNGVSSVVDLSGKHLTGIDLPAFNTIAYNNNLPPYTTGEIEFQSGNRIILGTTTTGTTTFGQNNIISNNSGNYLIYNSSGGNLYIGGINSEGINKNYWAFGTPPTFVALSGIINSMMAPTTSVSFLPSDPEYSQTQLVDPNSEGCTAEYNESIKGKGVQPLSVELIDTQLCNRLFDHGERLSEGMEYGQSYDTLRLYIENCAMQYDSYGEFVTLDADLDFMDTSLQRWVDGREWFKKVLYYNPDTNYYCADVDDILHTFSYFEGRGQDNLGYLAVIKYLHDSHKCLAYNEIGGYDTTYVHTMNQVISTWRDSVKDSLKTPLDTTLPSIDQLGLGILRGQNAVVSASGANGFIIGDLSLFENPFRNEAILRYHLNQDAMVHVDIFDALGRRMAGEGEGYKHEGDYQISFDARTWSSGTYYIRVSTMSGEVQTLKAIKEQ